MNAIAEEVRREVLAAYEGTEDDVLLETPLSGTLFTGYTRLYIPVVVSAPGPRERRRSCMYGLAATTASACVQHCAEIFAALYLYKFCASRMNTINF